VLRGHTQPVTQPTCQSHRRELTGNLPHTSQLFVLQPFLLVGPVDLLEQLFTGAEFMIDGKPRIIVLRENGNGKTTLLRLLTGELSPISGEVERDSAARIAVVNLLLLVHVRAAELEATVRPVVHLGALIRPVLGLAFPCRL
jgi:hypothetical protein